MNAFECVNQVGYTLDVKYRQRIEKLKLNFIQVCLSFMAVFSDLTKGRLIHHLEYQRNIQR